MTAEGRDQDVVAPRTHSGRYAHLRASVGRHPADLLRVAIAAAVVLWCWRIAANPRVNPVETAILQDIQQLPRWSRTFWRALTMVGWWPGVLAAAGFTAYRGRMRMTLSLVVAGVGAGVLAELMDALTVHRTLPVGVVAHLASASGQVSFPSVHAAVAAALATSAGPYIWRRLRTASWIVVVLVCTADVFLGQHLTLGVFAGAFLGWGTGAAVHLLVGAPRRATTEASVRLFLNRANLLVEDVTRLPGRLGAPQQFAVDTAERGQLTMTVVRRLHRRAGPAYKLRRLIASLEVEDEPALSTPRHEVDHEAYITLLAERAGVRTLPVVLAGELEHGAPFLLRQRVEGRGLADLEPHEVSARLLDELWQSVLALNAASIVHHDLRACNILVDTADHPHLTSFTFSRVGGKGVQGAQDLAELLVSIASVVGVERALDSAARSLDRPQLEALLPRLQGLALPRTVRGQLRSQNHLADLRETLADRLDSSVPSLRSPIRPVTLAMLLTGGVAVYLLLPELSSTQAVVLSLAGATWWWLAITMLISVLAIITSAWTIFGASAVPLPFWRTIAVQVAAAFTGRTTVGGVGFFGVNIVFLEKLGLRRSNAVGVVLMSRIGHGLISAFGTIAGLLAIGTAVPVGSMQLPSGPKVWIIAAAVVAALAALAASPWGRARVLAPAGRLFRDILRDLGPLVKEPRRAAQMFGGSFVTLGLSALGLFTTLEAFHPGTAVLPVMAVFIVATTIGGLAPTPGGLGAVEAAMVAGLTAIGVGGADAVAAVLACRLLTFWLPVIPGVAAFRILQHHQVV